MHAPHCLAHRRPADGRPFDAPVRHEPQPPPSLVATPASRRRIARAPARSAPARPLMRRGTLVLVALAIAGLAARHRTVASFVVDALTDADLLDPRDLTVPISMLADGGVALPSPAPSAVVPARLTAAEALFPDLKAIDGATLTVRSAHGGRVWVESSDTSVFDRDVEEHVLLRRGGERGTSATFRLRPRGDGVAWLQLHHEAGMLAQGRVAVIGGRLFPDTLAAAAILPAVDHDGRLYVRTLTIFGVTDRFGQLSDTPFRDPSLEPRPVTPIDLERGAPLFATVGVGPRRSIAYACPAPVWVRPPRRAPGRYPMLNVPRVALQRFGLPVRGWVYAEDPRNNALSVYMPGPAVFTIGSVN